MPSRVQALNIFEPAIVRRAIADAFQRGSVIGGTSAGTACQSDTMITGEGNFKVIRANSVELWEGFGFFRGVVVDQHFIARQRSNRLISVILEHPELLGVGYIIGPKLASLNFSGGLLAWGLLVPIIAYFIGPTLFPAGTTPTTGFTSKPRSAAMISAVS